MDTVTAEESASPIFVVGPPRSGTTLLKNILNRHPDIWITQETHFMDIIYPLRDQLQPDRPDDMESLVDRIIDQLEVNLDHDEEELPFTKEELLEHVQDRKPSSYREVFKEMIDLSRTNHGARIGGEKTPRHLFHLANLLDWFPDATVYMMVRDGRDFLSSYKYYHEREEISNEERDRIASLFHPITTSIMWWSTAKVCLSWAEDDRVNRVRFERLVTEPEETVEQILEEVDLKYDPEMLQVKAANTSFEEDEESRGIQEAPIRRWEERLTRGERFWFRLINEDVMYDLGYVMNGRGGCFEGMLYVFTFPWQVVRALWKNRHRTKNIWSFLWKRLNPG